VLAAVVLVAGVTTLSPAGGAAAPDTVFLEELTWPEVRDLIRAGKTTIILPTGGTEQNGPHMALGKHNTRVRVNAEAIARRLGNALVAPVLAYVPEGRVEPPTGHMRFAGTITLPDPWFEKVLEFGARSFKAHAFRDIVFIGDSGENQPGQQRVAARLNREWARTPVRVHAIEAYYRATAVLRDRLRAEGYAERDLDGHAALLDTALMLAIDPRLVRTDRLGAAAEAGSGATGDPSRARAELGRPGVAAIVERTVDAIRSATARHTPDLH
jgi:creatinine amidohydrolase/Fe(II)-dependent formamide hydrolase-like protein